jgi:sugar phosphate isomerase/epimerase
MKFAFCTNILRRRPLTEAVEVIAKAGFKGVELVADRPHAFPEETKAPKIMALKESVEKHRLEICALNSCRASALGDDSRPSWVSEDWEEREKRIRYTLDCFRLAGALGVPSVITHGGGRIPESMTRNDGWRLFVANMHRVLPLAQKLGVKLLVQPAPGEVVESAAHVLDLFKELEEYSALGVSFDAVHFRCTGQDLCDAWKLLYPFVGLVHLEDSPQEESHQHTQLGEGNMDIPRFLRSVEESGYEGFVSIEMEAKEQTAEETVNYSARYLKQQGFLG